MYSDDIQKNDTFEFNLEFFICGTYDSLIEVDTNGPFQVTATTDDVICFSVEFINNNARLTKCNGYLVFNIKPTTRECSNLKFSFQIYKV